MAATKNSNAIPSVQARRVYPQYGVRTLIPAYVGPAGNDVEATSEYNGVYASVAKRLSHGVQFRALVHPQQVREQQRRLARRERDRRLEPAPAEHVRLRGGVEPVAVRRAQPLRRELPLGGPRPEVRRPEAHPRRLAVLRHHRVPVGAAVHDRHRRRLERRRDDRLRPAEPRQRDPATGTTSTRPSPTTATSWLPLGTNNLPLANASATARSAATPSAARPSGTPTSAC